MDSKTEKVAEIKQLCVVCASEISNNAKKCIHCGSYQSLIGRYINFNVPVLSLLVAIIALLSASSEKLYDYIYPKKDITASIKLLENNYIELDAANESNESVILKQVWCHLKTDNRLDTQEYISSLWSLDNEAIQVGGERKTYVMPWRTAGVDEDGVFWITKEPIENWFERHHSGIVGDGSRSGISPHTVCTLTYSTPRHDLRWLSIKNYHLDEMMSKFKK